MSLAVIVTAVAVLVLPDAVVRPLLAGARVTILHARTIAGTVTATTTVTAVVTVIALAALTLGMYLLWL